MPDAAVRCPFCNTPVPTAGTERIRCPRCGDYFVPSTTANRATGFDGELQRQRDAHSAGASRSVKRMLLIAGSLGVLGLIVGWVISSNREPLPPPPPAQPTVEAAVAPLAMPVLSYLPAGTDSVIALQLRAYIESFPEGDDRNPRNALLQLGIPDELLGSVERILGLPLDQIDQFAVGGKLNAGLLASQPVIVVRTRTPFSMETIAKRAKATADKRGERIYYRTNSANPFGERFYWWAPNDKLLIIAMQGSVLDGIPVEGRAGSDHLDQRLRDNVAALLTADTPCWALFESDDWQGIATLAMLAGKKKNGLDGLSDSLTDLQTVILGVRVDNKPTLTIWLEMKSDTAAAGIRDARAGWFRKEQSDISIGGAGSRIMLLMPPRGDNVSKVLKRIFLEDNR